MVVLLSAYLPLLGTMVIIVIQVRPLLSLNTNLGLGFPTAEPSTNLRPSARVPPNMDFLVLSIDSQRRRKSNQPIAYEVEREVF